MDIQELIHTLGFPIFCVVSLGIYIWKNNTRDKDEAKEREDKLIDNNTKVACALERVSDTIEKNAEDTKGMIEKSVEANKSMVNIVHSLVDSIKGDLKDVKDKVDDIKGDIKDVNDKIIEYESSRNKIL